MNYSWPGNVRELENCMERAVLTATGDCVHGHNLPPSLQAVQASGEAAFSEDFRNCDYRFDSIRRKDWK